METRIPAAVFAVNAYRRAAVLGYIACVRNVAVAGNDADVVVDGLIVCTLECHTHGRKGSVLIESGKGLAK